MVPIRIPRLLFSDVLEHYSPNVLCRVRHSFAQTGGNAALDVSSSVEMGVLAGFAPGIVRLGRSIRLRVLQLDAYVGDNRSGYDGSIQTEKLVRVLSDGNDDAGNLSN